VPLTAGTSTIGRDPAVAVPLASHQASWHHAAIEVAAAGCTVTDLESKNGTMVNGARVSPPTKLGDGDEITIAGTRLVFRTGAPEGGTRTTTPT